MRLESYFWIEISFVSQKYINRSKFVKQNVLVSSKRSLQRSKVNSPVQMSHQNSQIWRNLHSMFQSNRFKVWDSWFNKYSHSFGQFSIIWFGSQSQLRFWICLRSGCLFLIDAVIQWLYCGKLVIEKFITWHRPYSLNAFKQKNGVMKTTDVHFYLDSLPFVCLVQNCLELLLNIIHWPADSGFFSYTNQALLSFYACFITAFQYVYHIFVLISNLITDCIFENSFDFKSSCYISFFV